MVPSPSPLLPYGPVIETHKLAHSGDPRGARRSLICLWPCTSLSQIYPPARPTAGLQPSDRPASPQEIRTAQAWEGLPDTKDTPLPANGAPRTQEQASRVLLSPEGPDSILQSALERSDRP